jgi:hypothetical protein
VRSVLARGRLSRPAASRPLVRAAGFAGIAVPVSLVGHLAGGGAAPDEATLLLAVAATTVAVRLLLAGRERSWAAISAALGGAEFALHTWFGSGTGSGAGTGHGHLPDAVHLTGVPMTAGHLVAALVLGWFLRNGERALWSSARRVTVRSGALVGALIAAAATAAPVPIAPPPSRPGGPVPDGGLIRCCHRTTGGLVRRGPPVGRLAPAA